MLDEKFDSNQISSNTLQHHPIPSNTIQHAVQTVPTCWTQHVVSNMLEPFAPALTQLIMNHIRMHLISQLFQREVRNFSGIISTIKSCFFLSYITPYFIPRYYVRDVYMENILEKKLVNNLLRRSGKIALTTKKKSAFVTK